MARHKPAPCKTSHRSGLGELRIIGGNWRSRKLVFPDAGGVRPSPARTRETLFNWLNFHLAGSHCLDLFAGSGALGLEALSRGAAQATLVDNSPELTRALKANLQLLKSEHGTVVCQDVIAFLNTGPVQPFDIIFMDPPFRQGWLGQLFEPLVSGPWLKPGSWVYVEHEKELPAPLTPADWQLLRQKTAGQVSYNLYRVSV